MHTLVVRLCAALLCLGLHTRPAVAMPDIADFSLGMSREDILLRAASPCGDRLCGQLGFGGRIWDGSFRLRGNRLDAISLSGPPEDDYVEAAFSAFADSPYVVYRAVADNAVFDFPSLAAGGLGPEALDAAFDSFVHALGREGGSFVSFFYTEPAVYEALKREAREAPAPPSVHAGGADEEKDKSGPAAGPDPRADGVVCAMTIAADGIVILIMTRGDFEAEMEARAARPDSAAARGEGAKPVSLFPPA